MAVAVCHYCQESPPYPVSMTRDHIVPKSVTRRGLTPVAGVLRTVPACQDCNSTKGSRRVVREDGSDHCSICARSWVAYGPAGWSTRLATITVAKVVKKALKRERAHPWADVAVLPCG